MKVTLGGERLGSGNKQKVSMRNYERSTHNLGYVWRSTMAPGTLVPFMSEVALPGDSFDIDLDLSILTHPTIGPLFGSYKAQLDVFQIPIRLYQGQLHMNKLNIGLKMSNVKLPLLAVRANNPDYNKGVIENQQINPSCILSYLGLRGIGYRDGVDITMLTRDVPAMKLLAYWDIYKNYYANKQEEVGYVVHNNLIVYEGSIANISIENPNATGFPAIDFGTEPDDLVSAWVNSESVMTLTTSPDHTGEELDLDRVTIKWGLEPQFKTLREAFEDWEWDTGTPGWRGTKPRIEGNPENISTGIYAYDDTIKDEGDIEPRLQEFVLENIDQMRTAILEHAGSASAYKLDENTYEPYSLMLKNRVVEIDEEDHIYWSKRSPQEGLGIKCYQSDLFNNWISTEWMDGANGINEITAMNVVDDQITINEMLMSKKVYDMLNRIAISGGSYDDWLDSVYTHERVRSAENPMYMGGMIQEVIFQEVVSNSESEGQPLGTLAGRGVLAKGRKGGRVKVKVDEPSYIMGIVSLTPRIDYSQGNKWDMTELFTMDDFHKPALDEIGFQDLITEQMAWWDRTEIESPAGVVRRSAGKQPAWINYMTNVNEVRGNFAIQNDQMFMTLNRRYETEWIDGQPRIKDLTTYIDPKKFNHIFAQTRRDAQNFWTQIKVDITARRKMSAKVIPNL